LKFSKAIRKLEEFHEMEAERVQKTKEENQRRRTLIREQEHVIDAPERAGIVRTSRSMEVLPQILLNNSGFVI
jgi:hypothetical protein